MRHVVAARVLQNTPPRKTGGGTPSVPEGTVFPAPSELDLLAGMASDDTDYRKVGDSILMRIYATYMPILSASYML